MCAVCSSARKSVDLYSAPLRVDVCFGRTLSSSLPKMFTRGQCGVNSYAAAICKLLIVVQFHVH